LTQFTTILAATAISLSLTLLPSSIAEARLGEPYATFKVKAAKGFKFKSESKKDNRTYYMFSMSLDATTMQAAPGFAGGLTVTVINGHVTGQSMVMRLGENYEAGKALAVAHALDFAYESLGKPSPKSKDSTDREFQQYTNAIDMVIGGSPQNLRYPGFNGVITLSLASDQSVIIAATPDAAPPPGGPEPVNKANK
jgi:hypothetical protein